MRLRDERKKKSVKKLKSFNMSNNKAENLKSGSGESKEKERTVENEGTPAEIL